MIPIPEDIERVTSAWVPARDCISVYGFTEDYEPGDLGSEIARITLKELYEEGFADDIESIKERLWEVEDITRKVLSKIERFRCRTTFHHDKICVTIILPIDNVGGCFYQNVVYEYKLEQLESIC